MTALRRLYSVLLVPVLLCSVSDGTSIIELESGVPAQGLLGRDKQHFYFVNVSRAIGRNIHDASPVAKKRLSVTLRKGPSASAQVR